MFKAQNGIYICEMSGYILCHRNIFVYLEIVSLRLPGLKMLT